MGDEQSLKKKKKKDMEGFNLQKTTSTCLRMEERWRINGVSHQLDAFKPEDFYFLSTAEEARMMLSERWHYLCGAIA